MSKFKVFHNLGNVELTAAGNPLDTFEAVEHPEHGQVRQRLPLLIISRIIRQKGELSVISDDQKVGSPVELPKHGDVDRIEVLECR